MEFRVVRSYHMSADTEDVGFHNSSQDVEQGILEKRKEDAEVGDGKTASKKEFNMASSYADGPGASDRKNLAMRYTSNGYHSADGSQGDAQEEEEEQPKGRLSKLKKGGNPLKAASKAKKVASEAISREETELAQSASVRNMTKGNAQHEDNKKLVSLKAQRDKGSVAGKKAQKLAGMEDGGDREKSPKKGGGKKKSAAI